MRVSHICVFVSLIAACGSESAIIADSEPPKDAGASTETPVIQQEKDTGTPDVDNQAPDSSIADTGADVISDASVDAGVKGCSGTFVGSCRYSQQSDCWDYYGGNPDVFCPVEGGHTFSASHCADPSPYNQQPLAMKCHFPASTVFGGGTCKVMYRYGVYGPTMQSYCESNGGAVIYP